MAKQTDFKRLQQMAASITQSKPRGSAHTNEVLQSNSSAFNPSATQPYTGDQQRPQADKLTPYQAG